MSIDYEKEVLQRSHEVPVLVDFWAPWCGPCRTLGPILDSLSQEANGKWELVKLNVDENPGPAGQNNVRSIPVVKLFSKGKAIAEFTGALPKTHIQKWLDEHLPSEEKLTFALIQEQIATGEREKALPALESLLETNPDFEEARLLLARETVFQNPDRSLELVEGIRQGNPNFDQAERVRALVELFRFDETGDNGVVLKLKAASEAFRNKDEAAGIDLLIQAVMLDKSYANDLPRRACIALFDFWGREHPLSKQFTRRFEMALY